MKRTKVIIMGAAGRDFHNFNVFFRDNEEYKVAVFTATQIPGIENKVYPPVLSGKLYPKGLPIYPESKLSELIEEYGVEKVVFAYSDVSHQYVMHKASQALAMGCDFWLLGPKATQIAAKLPVISVCASRTGAGKSPAVRKIVKILKDKGKSVVSIRHPMPYGDLEKQIVQRFATMQDLDKNKCTIEEREEYQPHIKMGSVIYSGIDYQKIVTEAEKEAEILVWDGGNNDFSFLKSDLYIVVTDALRAGDELKYHPGETNLYLADIVIINKVNGASFKDLDQIKRNIHLVNSDAVIIETSSIVTADNPNQIKGKRVVVVEDGPTLTHGGMTYGAGYVAAKRYKAREIISPVKFATGSIKKTFAQYPHIKEVLPAMGYSSSQVKDLEQTINNMPVEAVVVGTPVDLQQILKLSVPSVRVFYELEDITKPTLEDEIKKFLIQLYT